MDEALDNTSDNTKPLPMAFEHSITVYRAMENQASVEDLNEEGATGLVYDGFTTNLIIKELHFSVPFYTTIIRDLKRMDCIRQLRRGGSTTSSRWLLMQPPTVELFTKMKAIKDTGKSILNEPVVTEKPADTPPPADTAPKADDTEES